MSLIRILCRSWWILPFALLSACMAETKAPAAALTQPTAATRKKAASPTAGRQPTMAWTYTGPPAESPQPFGGEVSLGVVHFIIPAGLAASADLETTTQEELPFVNPSMGPFPAHWVVRLQGYPLDEPGHEPRIIIFRSDEWEEFDGETIAGLRALQSAPNQTPDHRVFVFRFYAHVYILASSANTGVRYLTQHLSGNGHAVNNQDIFYYYRGLSADGGYYISAILPVNASFLQDTAVSAADASAGMIPLPPDPGDAAYAGYLQAVAQKINSSKPENWRPSLSTLDELIRSIAIG